MPRSSTPEELRRTGLKNGASVSPSAMSTASASPTSPISGLHTGPACSLCTLRVSVAGSRATLGSGCGSDLARQVGHLHRVTSKGFCFPCFLLLQASPGAHSVRTPLDALTSDHALKACDIRCAESRTHSGAAGATCCAGSVRVGSLACPRGHVRAAARGGLCVHTVPGLGDRYWAVGARRRGGHRACLRDISWRRRNEARSDVRAPDQYAN
jgi:hypothetical protein